MGSIVVSQRPFWSNVVFFRTTGTLANISLLSPREGRDWLWDVEEIYLKSDISNSLALTGVLNHTLREKQRWKTPRGVCWPASWQRLSLSLWTKTKRTVFLVGANIDSPAVPTGVAAPRRAVEPRSFSGTLLQKSQSKHHRNLVFQFGGTGEVPGTPIPNRLSIWFYLAVDGTICWSRGTRWQSGPGNEFLPA